MGGLKRRKEKSANIPRPQEGGRPHYNGGHRKRSGWGKGRGATRGEQGEGLEAEEKSSPD